MCCHQATHFRHSALPSAKWVLAFAMTSGFQILHKSTPETTTANCWYVCTLEIYYFGDCLLLKLSRFILALSTWPQGPPTGSCLHEAEPLTIKFTLPASVLRGSRFHQKTCAQRELVISWKWVITLSVGSKFVSFIRNEGSDYVAYGNSLAVNPFAEVIARADAAENIIYADIDLDQLEERRSQIPVQKQRRTELYEVRKILQ